MKTAAAARIAEVYAGALLDLAEQSHEVETVWADLDAVSTLLTQNPDFRAFLASPYFAQQAKQDVVRKLFSGRVQPLTLHLLLVMIDHDRAAMLPEIIERYRQLYRVYQGYETVSVTVAQPIDEQHKEKLTRELAEALNTKIDLDVHVDPAILGGTIIRYDDKMVDNSARGRLGRTVRQLLDLQKKGK
jgi:F-type H+-transporting ATPase subunit delta